MKRIMPVIAMCMLIAGTFAISGCSKAPDATQTSKPPANTNAAENSGTSTTKAAGTLTAKPNPIQVCDGTGAGITTLTWNTMGATDVEVRVGKPDGDLFAKTGPSGTWTTAKWVGDGMTFYLQDVSDGKALTKENTITTLTIKVTKDGCP